MKLEYKSRSAVKKSDANKLRRDGQIPAIIYNRGAEAETISVSASALRSVMRSVQQGRLSTAVFTLVDEKGNEKKAILKEIQYNVTNYDVLHLDFEELKKDLPINVKVPIECTGMNDCVGIKLGGVLRQVIRYLKVSCLPEKIPTCFFLDVKSLGIKQYKRLSDLEIPEGIRPIANMKEVAAVIVKR